MQDGAAGGAVLVFVRALGGPRAGTARTGRDGQGARREIPSAERGRASAAEQGQWRSDVGVALAGEISPYPAQAGCFTDSDDIPSREPLERLPSSRFEDLTLIVGS